MKIQIYRHKEYKQFYLVRSSYYGGSEDTEFYQALTDFPEALMRFQRYQERYEKEDENEFLFWANRFPNNKVTVKLKKEMEFDGYKGTLVKEMKLFVRDFELVTFKEVVSE